MPIGLAGPSLARPVGEADREKVAEAIELTGIAPFADRLVDTLSGGERQRVWLAMQVAQDVHACFWTSRHPRSTSPTRSKACRWRTGCRRKRI